MKDYTPEDLTWEMTINSDSGKAHAMMVLEAMFKEHGYLDIEIVAGKVGTQKQFSALHVWCEMVADVLTDAGIDKQAVLSKKSLPVMWTKDGVKQDLYKPVLLAISGKESTKEQTRVDPTRIVNVLARFIGTEFGVTIPPWPSKDNQGE